MNLCRACGRDFSSVENFDKHRIGKHEYDFVWRDEAKRDGRRCLNEDELRAIGLVPNTKGRWHDPAAVARARLGFEGRASRPRTPGAAYVEGRKRRSRISGSGQETP